MESPAQPLPPSPGRRGPQAAPPLGLQGRPHPRGGGGSSRDLVHPHCSPAPRTRPLPRGPASPPWRGLFSPADAPPNPLLPAKCCCPSCSFPLPQTSQHGLGDPTTAGPPTPGPTQRRVCRDGGSLTAASRGAPSAARASPWAGRQEWPGPSSKVTPSRGCHPSLWFSTALF